MKVWYLNHTNIQENCSGFEICATCSFDFLNSECCLNDFFKNIHPCCSINKHYRETIKSDIFNL